MLGPVNSGDNHLIPVELFPIFSSKPLLHFEDEGVYDAMVGQYLAAYAPRDAQEYLILKDIADAEWEVRRSHALIDGIVLSEIPAVLNTLIQEARQSSGAFVMIGHDEDISAIVRRALYERGGRRKFYALLKEQGISEQALFAAAYKKALSFIEKLLAARDAAARRKDKLLRQFDQRRQILELHTRTVLSQRHNKQNSTVEITDADKTE